MGKQRTPRKRKKERRKGYVKQFDDFEEKHNQEMKLKKLLSESFKHYE